MSRDIGNSRVFIVGEPGEAKRLQADRVHRRRNCSPRVQFGGVILGLGHAQRSRCASGANRGAEDSVREPDHRVGPVLQRMVWVTVQGSPNTGETLGIHNEWTLRDSNHGSDRSRAKTDR